MSKYTAEGIRTLGELPRHGCGSSTVLDAGRQTDNVKGWRQAGKRRSGRTKTAAVVLMSAEPGAYGQGKGMQNKGVGRGWWRRVWVASECPPGP